MRPFIRRWLSRRLRGAVYGAFAAALSGFACQGALAQAPAAALPPSGYPAKPVRFVNNFPPGGPSDLLARSVSEYLTAQTRQPFVTENRAGASGNIGAAAVAQSTPDGHTVLFGIDTTFTVNPHIYPQTGFRPQDLRPLMIIASSGLLVGVHPGTGIKSLSDLIAAGKSRTLNFSSGGNGSPGHLATQIFIDAMGVKIQHVPYKGNTPAVTAVAAGEVDGGVLATPGMLPQVRAGRIAALAVTSRERSRAAPELPTVAEAGLAEMQIEVLYGAWIPAATPEPIMQWLQVVFAEAMRRPETQAQLERLDLFYEGITGADAAQRLSETSARYARIIRATNMKVE